MQGSRIFVAIVILGAVLIGLLLSLYGFDNTWQLWNIPTMSPHFADLRTITGGAESARLGLDPMVENPADPWGRTMDYPRIWQALFTLGIDHHDTLWMALVMIVGFAAGLFLFVGDIDRTTAWVMAAAVFSPAVLLGIERGNNDLLIFFLLACALVVLRRHPVAATGLITLGGLLMYFPVFGLAALLRESRRKFLTLAGISSGILALYVLLTYKDVLLIGRGELRGTTISYGFNVLHSAMKDYFGSPNLGGTMLIVSLVCLAAIIVVGIVTRGRCFSTTGPANRMHLDGFRLGAAIYIGTFLLGNNWDYRLIFLLFAIPQLVEWSRATDGRLRLVSRLTLALVMASLWMQFFFRFAHFIPGGGYILFALDEAANWSLLAGLIYLLPRTCPPWLCGRADPEPGILFP